MNIHEIIALAEKNVNNRQYMQSSAKLCLEDAKRLMAEGGIEFARLRALKSLAYSVGVFSKDYQEAVKS